MKTLLLVTTLALGGSGLATASEAAAPIGADANSGFVDVASDPPARVFVDDADTGKVTPVVGLAVAPGHHKLTLVAVDGARRRTLGFTVDAGQTRKFTVHLAP